MNGKLKRSKRRECQKAPIRPHRMVLSYGVGRRAYRFIIKQEKIKREREKGRGRGDIPKGKRS